MPRAKHHFPPVASCSLAKRQRLGGFTLVELLVTVTLAVVLAAIALPDLTTFSRTNTVRTTANALVTTLNSARTEAMRANTLVTVCSADLRLNAAVVVPNCRSTSKDNWADGWVAFEDTNFDQNNTVVGNVRNVSMPLAPVMSVRSDGFTKPDSTNPSSLELSHAITFTPNGATLSGMGTLTVSTTAQKAQLSMKVTVLPNGYVTVGNLQRTPLP